MCCRCFALALAFEIHAGGALPRPAAAPVRPRFAGPFAGGAPVPRVAQAGPPAGLAAAVLQVALTQIVAAGPPPARLALARARALVARRGVAAAGVGTLGAPAAPLAPTPAGQLVAARPRRPAADALAGFGAGGVPPALLAGAVPVERVAAAVPGALAGVLAEGPPAVGVAGALARGGVAAAVGVAPARLAAVGGPELGGAAWWRKGRGE